MANPKIVIPMSEQDIDDIRAGEEFDWTFPTKNGREIDVVIRLEREEDIDGTFLRD